jgi:hypothetical protein
MLHASGRLITGHSAMTKLSRVLLIAIASVAVVGPASAQGGAAIIPGVAPPSTRDKNALVLPIAAARRNDQFVSMSQPARPEPTQLPINTSSKKDLATRAAQKAPPSSR